MVKSIYDVVKESRNRPSRNVTVVDNNGNVTRTTTKELKKQTKKK